MVEIVDTDMHDKNEFKPKCWGCNVPRIQYDNIINCLKSLEIRRDFNELSELEKIYMVLENADTRILIFHEEFVKETNINSLIYDDWRIKLIDNFKLRYRRQDFLESKQRRDETLEGFLHRVRVECISHGLGNEFGLVIAINGLRQFKYETELALVQHKELNEETIERIIRTHNICKRKRIFKKFKDGKRLNQTRNVNNVYKELVDKENFIKINKIRYKVIIDTGSGFNFVTEPLVNKLGLKVEFLNKKIDFFTCLNEKFFVSKQAEIKFEYGKKIYKEKFYILPKRKDEAILLGRSWINRKISIREEIDKDKTCEELLKELYKDNSMGVKGFKCEITTPSGKIIAENPYKIPQAYEDKVKEEIKRLLNKGYIRESKSSWLNNVRPVLKKDGSIRLTTNLIKLNVARTARNRAQSAQETELTKKRKYPVLAI